MNVKDQLDTTIDRAGESAGEVLDLAKQTADESVSRAKATTREARESATRVEQAVESTLKEAGYATLGAGDAAVHAVRNLAKASTDLPERVRRTPEALATFFEEVAANLRSGYVDLTDRGRQLTGQIKANPKVTEARKQTKTASAQVKGAKTSARKQSKAASAQAKGAATSVSKAAKTQAKAAGAAASTLGGDDAGTGKLEDRTVEELRTRAAELDIDGRSNMNKKQLITAIRSRQ